MSKSERRGPRDASAKPKSLQLTLGGLAFPDDNDALAFGEDVALRFDLGDDLSLGHSGAESRHEDLPDLGLDGKGAAAGTGRVFRITAT
ncbi:hypothetical protein ACFXTH_028598 [Malus domestica]